MVNGRNAEILKTYFLMDVIYRFEEYLQENKNSVYLTIILLNRGE